jgi:putative oxidoreductase
MRHPSRLKRLLFGGTGGGSPRADLGLLVLRLYTGLAFVFAHGLVKLRDPAQIIGGLKSMGFPAPTVMVWLAILGEFGGGVLLALGLATRAGAFLVGFTMCVAGLVVHRHDPFQVKELAFAYLAVAICFLFTGAGRYGLDAALRPPPRERSSR